MKITRSMNSKIVTSGYRDRFVRGDLKIIITVGDPILMGYTMEMDKTHAVNYLVAEHGMSAEDAIHAVRIAPLTATMPYTRGDSGMCSSGVGIEEIKNIERLLSIFNSSIRDEIRLKNAEETPLSPETFYAISWGLYECNRENADLERCELRPGFKTQVSHPVFDWRHQYDEAEVRAALVEIAKNPESTYHNINEDGNY